MLKAGRPSQNALRKAATLSSLREDQRSTRRVNFDVPAEEFHQLKIYAAKHGMSIKDIFRQYISTLLNSRS
jgi:predicted DNA binding CopG/RHH family protein